MSEQPTTEPAVETTDGNDVQGHRQIAAVDAEPTDGDDVQGHRFGRV